MKRILQALLYSLSGLKAAYKSEPAFRQEVWLAAILIPLAFYLSGSKYDMVLLIIPIFILLIAELINTAIESLADKITEEQDPKIKVAKDVGSAAVFIAIVNLVITWLVVLV